MEKIFIENLKVRAIIGTLPAERQYPQELCLDLELLCDGTRAAVSDDLRDAVDYSAVEQAVVKRCESSKFFLLEALARALGETVLQFPQVASCVIRISKPGASAYGALISYQAGFQQGQFS